MRVSSIEIVCTSRRGRCVCSRNLTVSRVMPGNNRSIPTFFIMFVLTWN